MVTDRSAIDRKLGPASTPRKADVSPKEIKIPFSPSANPSTTSLPTPPLSSEEKEQLEAEELLRHAAEASIARQISVSHQQRRMLIPKLGAEQQLGEKFGQKKVMTPTLVQAVSAHERGGSFVGYFGDAGEEEP
jgi:hypothetical protein